MAKLNEIQSAILRLDGGQFQKLVDTYIYKKFGYKNIMDYGSHTGTNKTTKGIPDTYFLLDTGKYVFVMYSSHEKNTLKKIKNDILDCLNETKTGIEVSKIQQIICCHTSSNIGPKQDAELRELCSSQGVLLDIFGIGAISQDLLNYYPIIARNELNIAVDSGQILTIDDFVDVYDENPMVTPIRIGILGREAELRESLEKINESKVLLVYGNSGVGKTRLVLEVCRAYIDSHESVICYCIKNNGLSLYEDLKSFIEIGKEYLIFIDDANQTSELRYLIEYVNKKNFNVKIIITVRDYAREHVEKIVRGYIIPEYLLLKPMSKEQINEIMKKELNIINSIFLERINIISKGNPRLAILAGRISKNKSLNDINNVEQLYESYYGKIIEEIDLFQNGTATRIAGLIAFFNTVNLEDVNLKEIVLFFSEVNSFIFDDIVNRLHDMEIIDLFENSAIKISEQSMGNYLLYYIFAKKRVVRLSDIIRQCFPAYKQKIIYAVNTITKLFNSDENTNYLISEISLVWDELAAKENSNFIEYMKMFYSVKQVETLKYIDGVVDQLDEVPFDAAKINFYKLNNNHHIGDTYLNILDGYKYSLYRKAAIELIIKYFKKRPDMFMDFFFCLTDGFGIDRSSQYNDYIVQQDVIEILILETKNFIEHNVNILFLRVAETFLELEFHPAESNEDGGVTIYTIPINCTDGSKRYRENIWRSLSEMFIKPVYRDMILGIIESYRRGAADYSKDMVLFDLENIFTFVRTNLSKQCFKHCRIVKHISRPPTDIPNDIKDFLNNQTFKVYELLKGERHLEEYDYQKERELKKEDIINYFQNYSLESIIDLFDCFSEIQLDSSRDTWEVNEGLSTLFELFAAKQDVYSEIVKIYIGKNTPLNANTYLIVNFLIKAIGDNETYKIITANTFDQKIKWISTYFMCLKNDQINKINLERLNTHLFNEETIKTGNTPTLEVLEQFIVLDKQIIVKTTCFLIERNEVNPTQLAYFLRIGLNKNKSDFDKLLDYYSSDLSVFKKAYLLAVKFDRHLDYDSWFLKNMLSADPSFLKEFLHFSVNNNESYHDSSPTLDVIWQLDNWHQLAWEAMEEYTRLCGERYWNVSEYMERLFSYKEFQDGKEENENKKQYDIELRQNTWIKEYIDKYYLDKERIELIFEVVSHFDNERRVDFVNYFVNKNDSYDFFEHLPLEPSTWSAWGSLVPMYEMRIDFLKSLLPLFNGLRFLKHRERLEQMIKGYTKCIKRELKSEFLKDR